MSNRKPTFFTSDWHVGHKNVINFSNRPFVDVDQMQRTLIRNYNTDVPDSGICYFLGDMATCGSERMREVMHQLNGTKVLILGNHDKDINTMYNMGFDVVIYNAMLRISNEIVTMSHCPMLGKYRENTLGMKSNSTGDPWHGASREKHRKFTVKEHEHFHLHGHIHSPNGGKSKKIEGKQYDVGVDANKYRPVNISHIESWLAKYKMENP